MQSSHLLYSPVKVCIAFCIPWHRHEFFCDQYHKTTLDELHEGLHSCLKGLFSLFQHQRGSPSVFPQHRAFIEVLEQALESLVDEDIDGEYGKSGRSGVFEL